VTASASEEALRALEETGRLDLVHVGVAARELGHIRVRLGDTEGAEQAFRRAHEYGISPEPGMSLVRLVRGDPVGATQGLQTALDALGDSRLVHRLLERTVHGGQDLLG
jgi:hypothetical protein